jgi:hypothetical protein
MKVELCYFEGCPHVELARARLADALGRIGLAEANIEERVGDCASPTILVDGRDPKGAPLSTVRSCRIDLPTTEELATWLLKPR